MDKLNRTLTLPLLLVYGIGSLVGAGIYSIVGAAAGVAGHALWLSLLLAGVPALLAAFCYAEMSTRYPRAAAAYVYMRNAIPSHRWPGFLVGFLMAATCAATAATVAIAFAGYVQLFLDTPVWLPALGLIAVCTAVNIVGIRESAWVTAVGTVIEVLGLVLIIGGAIAVGRFGERWLELAPATGQGVLAAVFAGAALSFFVFTGFEGLADLAEETKDPGRTLPRALFISLGVTTVLYVLIAIAATSLAEPRALAESASPLSTAAREIDPRLAGALGWIALFSTANTCLITLVVASRLLFGMAEAGDMPPAMARTLPRRRTPWVAALAIAGAALLLLPLGRVAIVGSVSSLLVLIVFLGVGLSLVLIRLREHAQPPGTFRAPLNVGRFPLVPVLLVLSIAVLATRFEPRVYAVAGGTLAAGLAIAAARAHFGRPARPLSPRALEPTP